MFKKEKNILHKYYNIENKYEISIDECGRGPLFGRTYVAAVILPNNDTFNYSILKDSKKFSSKKKIKEVAEYIKKNAIAYSIQYIDENEIDKINILQSVLKGMNLCITDIINNKIKLKPENYKNTLLLVDGNQFTPFVMFDKIKEELVEISHITIEGGDNLYCGIAAASIIAKVEHDEYILNLCSKYPLLVERYKLDTNVGYGTRAHLEGIRKFGICQFHRKTFGICKTADYNPV
jgi:ribonuclease HII